jgi:magnesium and cobalt transporter
MSISEIVFAALAIAGLLFFLACHASRPGRMSATTLRRLRLDDHAFLEVRRLLAELYVARILSLSGSALFFGLWVRLHGFGELSASGLAVAYGLATSLFLAPMALRYSLSDDRRSDRIVRFLRRPLALSGVLLEVLPGLSLRGASQSRVTPIESPFGRDLLRLLLRLRERHISEVMVARVDMVCAEESSTISELAELAIDSGHTRIPVFRGTIDSISGYVTAKDVVLRLHKGSGADGASSIVRKPVFVTPRASIEHCLEQMQRERAALAIVADSAGKTMGLVTSEDILEEVVGDLYEDYEPEEPAYRMLDEKTAQIRANVKLGDLKEILGAAPGADPAQSLGEYVRSLLGADAVSGDSASDDTFLYKVTRMVGKTIWSLRVERKA